MSITARIKRELRKNWVLYLMLLPGILFFIIYRYGPMWGLVIAFQNYTPVRGIMGSQWVGFRHFERFFTSIFFWQLLRNTLILSLLGTLINFPLPIIMALMLNELRSGGFKKVVQQLTYIPHFISWVVIYSITFNLFTFDGVINQFIYRLTGNTVPFMMSEFWFRPMIIMQSVWRSTGWGTIIFLAALAGIDQELYEAAKIDGAKRMQMIWYITLPSLKFIVTILLILNLGSMLHTGFEQVFLMLNAMNRYVGEVFDTYVFRIGIQQGQFSYSATIGMFRSVVSFVLVLGANRIAKSLGEEGLF